MSLEIKKVLPVDLRSVGLDEKWLQDRIKEDPGILGLGDLEIAGREHRQPVGGRIDFLMRDAEAETYYEVEVMLGTLDESHIIRTIEYWDIERQRRPQFEHRAVIVAESITARFFNVLRLLNRAVPMIAIKLSALRIGDSIILSPVTVLDVIEEVDLVDAVDQVEQTDRAYWEKNQTPHRLRSWTRLSPLCEATTSTRDSPTIGIMLLWAQPGITSVGFTRASQQDIVISNFEPGEKRAIPSYPNCRMGVSMRRRVARTTSASV